MIHKSPPILLVIGNTICILNRQHNSHYFIGKSQSGKIACLAHHTHSTTSSRTYPLLFLWTKHQEHSHDISSQKTQIKKERDTVED